MGLMHAAATYDPTRGASFKTFAYTAIRGAILDEIRKHDPVPRNRRDRLRQIERASKDLYATLQREPTMLELAEAMQCTIQDLEEDFQALHTARTLSLDDTGGGGSEEDSSSLASALADESIADPGEGASARERVAASRAVVTAALAGDRAVYGLNTGFGSLSRVRIDRDRARDLQKNIIRSHACGVGEYLPRETSRALIALNSALRSVSATRICGCAIRHGWRSWKRPLPKRPAAIRWKSPYPRCSPRSACAAWNWPTAWWYHPCACIRPRTACPVISIWCITARGPWAEQD
jgi:hypothetical protein